MLQYMGFIFRQIFNLYCNLYFIQVFDIDIIKRERFKKFKMPSQIFVSFSLIENPKVNLYTRRLFQSAIILNCYSASNLSVVF